MRVLLATAALMATVAACGGSDGDSDLPEMTATPSVTQKTTGTLLDEVPSKAPDRPKDVKSKAGAFAFGDYAADLVFYVLSTNDVDALTDVADGQLCTTCTNLRNSIEKRSDRIQVGEGKHTVSRPELVFHEGAYYTVSQTVRFPSGAEVDRKTGKVFEKLDAQTQEMTVNMQWRKDTWVLLDYKFAKGKTA